RHLAGETMPRSLPGLRTGYHPPTPGLAVAATPRLPLRREDGPLTSERVTARIALPLRHPYRVFLLDPGRALVEGEVEPCCEQVLVERGAETRCDLRVVGGIVAVSGGERDPGRLGFEPDGAVQIQVPVETVVVVAHRREERDDQPAVASRVVDPGPHFRVFRQDGCILLVHADAVVDGAWISVVVGDSGREVCDLPETVAAEFEGVGVLSQHVLAR